MKRLTLLTTILLLLAACTPATTPQADTPPATAPEPELIRADLPRLLAPDVAETQIEQLVQGNNRFAFDLYQAIRENDGGNLIYSPYSISLAFSMVYAGARGQTEAEMAQVLHFLSQDVHHPAFNALDQRLAALTRSDDEGEESGRFQLNIANAVWGQIGLPFEDAYLAILAEQYGAGLRASDFERQPEEARQEINGWIAEQTADRIRDILPPGAIDPLTRLVLANAIYFNAAWRFPFDADATQDGPFTLLDGSQVTAPLMRQGAARIRYAEGMNYQAVAIPYTERGVEMVVILPQTGEFETVEAALGAEFVQQVRRQAELREVQLTMPRFEFETDLDLKALLTSLGMQNSFTPSADFSGIVAIDDLYISDALHRGTITVDEEGTEAAAATVIVMEVTGMPETAVVTLDRPFILAIVAEDSGAVLFLGRVMNPAVSN
jgi:serpin B